MAWTGIRFGSESGSGGISRACPLSLDTVAKLPKSRVTNLRQIDQTSRNRCLTDVSIMPLAKSHGYFIIGQHSPQTIIRSPHVRPGKFVLVDAKRFFATLSSQQPRFVEESGHVCSIAHLQTFPDFYKLAARRSHRPGGLKFARSPAREFQTWSARRSVTSRKHGPGWQWITP